MNNIIKIGGIISEKEGEESTGVKDFPVCVGGRVHGFVMNDPNSYI